MSEPRKRARRSENWAEEDKNLLFDLVCDKIQIIEHKGNSTEINVKKKAAWDEIANLLSSKCYQKRPYTVEQVKLQWKRMKLTIKKDSPTLYNELKNGFQECLPPPPYKNVTQGKKRVKWSAPKAKSKSLFRKVRKCCADLIMKHGRSADLLDDAPFREILKFIPMTDEEREKLTSVAIMEYIDDDDQWSCDDSFGDGDDEEVNDDDFEYKSDEEMEQENPSLHNIPIVKKEREDCSCPSRDEGTHETGCLVIAREPLQYFEMSSTEHATCKLCSTQIQWSSLVDLKVHLTLKHATLMTDHTVNEDPFTADRGNSQGNQSTNGETFISGAGVTIEQVLLQEDPPLTAKKRKFRKSAVVTLRDDESIGIERFKSLDQFGLYVASLMKLLPMEKSIKYQEEIVQNLLREQAAAG